MADTERDIPVQETEETQGESKPKKSKKDNRVSLFVPRGPERGDPNLFISVNGVNYLLPRGKTSMVPPEVAEEYARAERAKEAFYELSDTLIENSSTTV